MSKTKKIILSIIISLLSVSIIFCIVWICKNFNSVKQAFNGTQLYTQTDLDNAYSDGKKDGLDEKNNYYDEIDGYKEQVVYLQGVIADYEDDIKEYESKLRTKDDTIADLKLQLEEAINQRDYYKKLYEDLKDDYEELLGKYEEKCDEVTKLQNKIVALEDEIVEIRVNYINARNKIIELEGTVNCYDNFLKQIIAENQVVAKFYYDNSLYSIMILQKGDKAIISNPVDTTYKKFLGWMLDDEIVDLTNYPINESVTFTAKINTFYDVTFKVDDEIYDTDIVVDGSYSKVPTIPTKEGYEFVGWTVNNVVYDVDTYSITKSTVFEAKFVKLNKVQFNYKENVINTQTIRTGEHASVVYPDVDDYTQFNYWMVNGIKVNIEEYVVTSDVVFVANITNKYDVNFMYEGNKYSSQIVLDGSYPIQVTPPTSETKVFKGWSLDKENIIDVTTVSITEKTTFYAVIDYYYFVTFKYDDDSVYGKTQLIKESGYATLPEDPTKEGYEFDYWTLDKSTEINVQQNKITAETIYYAKFTKIHNVVFKYENEIISTQTIRDKEYATEQTVDSTERKVFNGWKVDGNIVKVSTYPITTDITFVADITYKSLVQFKFDDILIQSSFVENNTKVSSPDLSSYSYLNLSYWTTDGSTEIDLSTYSIKEDTTFIAKGTKTKLKVSLKSSDATTKTYNSTTYYSYTLSYINNLVYNNGSTSATHGGYSVEGSIIINGVNHSLVVDAETNSAYGVSSYYRAGSYSLQITSSYKDSLTIAVLNNVGIESFTLDALLTPNRAYSNL